MKKNNLMIAVMILLLHLISSEIAKSQCLGAGWLTNPANGIIRTNTNTEAVAIGFITIGSVDARLHVDNNALCAPIGAKNGKLFRTDGDGGIENNWRIFTGGTEKYRLYIPQSSSNVRMGSLGYQAWETNGFGSANEKMRLTISGELLVGTTTGGFRLQVGGGHVNVTDVDRGYYIQDHRMLAASDYNGTLENTYCGFNTGTSSGFGNTLLGYAAGQNITQATHNTLVGAYAGQNCGLAGDNTFVGYGAGMNTQGFATANSFFGGGAGQMNISGQGNVFVGGRAGGNNNISGSNNVYVGTQCGSNNDGNDNVFLGTYTGGVGITASNRNTYAGTSTGAYNVGSSNVFIGYNLVSANPNDVSNSVIIGEASAPLITTTTFNTMIGIRSASDLTVSYENAFLGDHAGGRIVTRPHNTHIGSHARALDDFINTGAFGYDTEVCDNNTQRFGNDDVKGWGFGICVDPTHAITVYNGAHLTTGGSWQPACDRNLKENIQELDKQNMLNKLLQLPITKWKYKNTANEYHFGPMAQDFQQIFSIGDDKSIGLIDVSSVAILGVQALYEINAEQKTIIEEQIQKIASLETRLENLENDLAVCCHNYSSGRNTSTVSDDNARLEQNKPNPFNQITTIRYYIPSGFLNAEINVYSLNGNLLKTFAISAPGTGEVTFDGNTFRAGTYVYSLNVDHQQIDSKWMTLTK